MKTLLLTIGLFLTLTSCQSEEEQTAENLSADTHKITVAEVLQTNNYTYLLAEENGTKTWLAVPKMNANVGDVYYYDGGMLMENFASKELGRTFDKIYFLESVRTTPDMPKQNMVNNPHGHNLTGHNEKPKAEKTEIKVTPAAGGITIEELFANKSKYNGKTVKIKGVVVKFSPQIMKKNWIHIQDGTEHNGDFDLTVTSQSEVKEGDTVVVEGKISLDKDFGYGYFYKIIMEDAIVK